MEEFSGKSSGEWTSRQKKRYDKNSNRTRQKNKRRDRKVESNDSPGIPDRGETSDISGLPSGVAVKGQMMMMMMMMMIMMIMMMMMMMMK